MDNNLNRLIVEFTKYNLDAYIIPCQDEYQNEFPVQYKKRLEYITGFSGSNGLAIIQKTSGMFFTDGRYTIQAQQELDLNFFTIYDIANISTVLSQLQNLTIGYDPNLFTQKQIMIFQTLQLHIITHNLIDSINPDIELNTVSDIYEYDVKFSGESREDKILKLHSNMQNCDIDYQIITSNSIVAWLLNLRASFIKNIEVYSPIMDCRCILSRNDITLYVPQYMLSLIAKLNLLNITLKTEQQFFNDISNIQGTVSIDSYTCSIQIQELLKSQRVVHKSLFYYLARAKKNNIELQSIKKIHIKESIVLCELLAWIDNNIENNINEYSVCLKLQELRSNYSEYVMDSFHTICGYKENSAVIHYRPNPSTSKRIDRDGILLIDTGGQYIGGTTDTTRTIVLSKATEEQKKYYTMVLAGHIDIATLKFQQGTGGNEIEILARRYLWQERLSYQHSTGHGVGNFANVHESPMAISKYNNIPFEKGMILSNEPGVYLENQYGIRIENLIYIRASDNYLEFENLILVPYCKQLINTQYLSTDQKQYIQQYEKRIMHDVYNFLSNEGKKWLKNNLIYSQ